MGISQPRLIYPTPTSLPRSQKSRKVSLPPPVGGWNTRDDPVRMEPTDATDLINFFPEINQVVVRGGYTEHATLEVDTAVEVDGTNTLEATDSNDHDFGTGDFSLEFWTKHNATSDNDQGLVGKRDGSNAGWEVRADYGTFEIEFILEDTSANAVLCATTGDALPNDGSNHHVAITVDRTADEANIYVDAVLAGGSPCDISTVTATTDNTTGLKCFFSEGKATVHGADGVLSDVRLWGDVRTSAEISANYQSELTGSETGLVGYWKMDGTIGASVTTVTDDSSNSNTLTDTGAGDLTYVRADNITDYVTNIDTVIEFFNGVTRRLLAASPTNIYNATSAGAATSLAGSFTNGRWQTSMMNGVMGLVNGDDAPQEFDGTTVSAMTISGPTIANLIGIYVFKNRSYFWEDGSQSFWYSGTDALGGVLTEFALGEVAAQGGELIAMTSWTRDGGSGPDDFAVFIMSSGEVIVYQGSDPGTAADWAKVGSYSVPPPLDIRGIAKLGGDIALLTDADIILIPAAFNRATPEPSKLIGAIKIAGPTYRANTGWQAIFYRRKSMLILNIPISATEFEQYVMNVDTGAPARFIDIPARAWGIFDSDLYFGSTNGIVYQADSGFDDDNTNINCDAKQAWSDLGSTGIKQINAFRYVFSGTSEFDAGGDIGFDFVNAVTSRSVTTGGSGTAWGSPWGSPWGSTQIVIQDWTLAAGSGQVVSAQVSLGIQDQTPAWYRTDFMIAEGFSI